MQLDMKHFEELRSRVNAQLEVLRVPTRREQIDRYPWLYGALGEVPSKVMFICENPSLTPTRSARNVDGGPPDIETQWWGSPTNNAAKRFRRALYVTGLKETSPNARGGWRCYITNVIKEANLARDQEALPPTERFEQARVWAPILRWQVECVAPEHVFTVGSRADASFRRLQSHGLVPPVPCACIMHYSARNSDESVLQAMTDVIRRELR